MVRNRETLTERDSEPSDGELLRRHQRGDATAFPALVRRYQRGLYAFLTRFTGDATLAEDIFQETFLQVHLSAGMFDPNRPFRPWLFTVAANKARDALRSRGRHAAAPLDATVPGASENGTSRFVDLMPSGLPGPDEISMNSETRQAVQEMVSGMPESLRTVLDLSYFQEMPYKEIAEVLNVPLGTVKSRLHAAVRQFAQQWKAWTRDRTDRGGEDGEDGPPRRPAETGRDVSEVDEP